jgi:hypothetical protein
MAISRREMEFLVARGPSELDAKTLSKVACTVLGSDITVQGNRVSFSRIPAKEVKSMADIKALPAAAQVKLTAPQVAVLLDVLGGNERFADYYAPAKKVVELGLANWKGNSGLSSDRLILTEDGKARAEYERDKRQEG